MKKIIIIDGGPRKNFNLATLFESFKEGVRSVSEDIEVKHVCLYDLDYKGCVACMGCKIVGGKNVGRCIRKDGLSELLEELNTADGVALGSPIYFLSITGELESALERIVFPYLSYRDYSVSGNHNVPTAMFYTMNGTPEAAAQFDCEKVIFDRAEMVIGMMWQKPERVVAYNTYQVKDYSRYEFNDETEPEKRAWRDAHFPEYQQQAFEAGRRMTQKIYTHK